VTFFMGDGPCFFSKMGVFKKFGNIWVFRPGGCHMVETKFKRQISSQIVGDSSIHTLDTEIDRNKGDSSGGML
jgi:hypothetical protein